MHFVSDEIKEYCFAHSTQESQVLKNITQATELETTLKTMLSGKLVGGLLQFLIRSKGIKQVLELGCFTGYSALTMAEALPPEGRVTTLDTSVEYTDIAKRFFKTSAHGHKITVKLGQALQTLKTFEADSFDLIFVDADKENYRNYLQSALPLLKSGGLMVFDNALLSGKVLAPSDLASRSVHETNELANTLQNVTKLMLPLRDGVLILEKH